MKQKDYKTQWVQTGKGQWLTERNNLWFHITLMDRWYLVAVIEKQRYARKEINPIAGKRTLQEAKIVAEQLDSFQ